MIFKPFNKTRINETYLGYNYENSMLTILPSKSDIKLAFDSVPQFIVDGLTNAENPDEYIDTVIKPNYKLI